MSKYKKNEIVIEAKIYQKGMEDGFNTYAIGGTFTGYFDKGSALPKNNRIPVIKTFGGAIQISEGDYIIIDDKGQKSVCNPYEFKALYSSCD